METDIKSFGRFCISVWAGIWYWVKSLLLHNKLDKIKDAIVVSLISCSLLDGSKVEQIFNLVISQYWQNWQICESHESDGDYSLDGNGRYLSFENVTISSIDSQYHGRFWRCWSIQKVLRPYTAHKDIKAGLDFDWAQFFDSTYFHIAFPFEVDTISSIFFQNQNCIYM